MDKIHTYLADEGSACGSRVLVRPDTPRAHVRTADGGAAWRFSAGTYLIVPESGRLLAVRSRARFLRRARSLIGFIRLASGSESPERTPWRPQLRLRSDRLLMEYLSPERLAFFEELASIFAAFAPRRILDVGCGTGHLLLVVVDRMTASPERIVGIDHSEAGIRRARALLPVGNMARRRSL